MYLNKVILYGNLTRDPELKSLPSGTKVASFGIATNRRYKDQSGAWKEQADFHNIVAFGKQAETIAQYLKKGRPIFIEGRIQTRSWDDQGSGQKRYRTEIVLDRFQFGADGGRGGQGGTGAPKVAESTKDTSAPVDTIEYPSEEINPDDIPF